MQIRPAFPGEYKLLGDLAAAAYLRIPGMSKHPDHIDELRDVAARAVHNTILVALVADRPTGLVTYVPDHSGPLAEFDDPHAAGIRGLAVDPAYQRQGIGRALTVACIDLARRDGKSRVILHTTDELVAAHALYRSMGFARDQAHDFTGGGVKLMSYVYSLRD
ncbi:MAG: GNAT family N-acetyltransferase [Acidimicrobiia bacterium]|nr:GNAT family N-acetyltransferase [Acidimicrobiia bacterium]